MAEWIAITLDAVVVLIGFVISWVKIGARMENVEKQQAEYDKHIANTDLHWTARERDALILTMADMQKDIKLVLLRVGVVPPVNGGGAK